MNSALLLGCIVIFSFYAHQLLQYYHFRYCKSTIVRILFFEQSSFCVYLNRILNLIERAYTDVGFAMAKRCVLMFAV